jgi:hypothetical protein
MGFFQNLKESMGGVDGKLMKEGTLVRGRVISCQPTGVEVSMGGQITNTKQVCNVTVEITGLPGHEPYQASCKCPVPVLNLTAMQQPGVYVSVRVDPADPQHIAIDLYTEVPEGDGSEVNGVPITKSDMKAADVLAQGADCRVVIVQSMPLNQNDSQGLPAIGFVLSVFIEGKPPYQVQVGMGVPPEAVPLVFPGANLPGKYVADHPELAVIDWTAAVAAATQGPPV